MQPQDTQLQEKQNVIRMWLQKALQQFDQTTPPQRIRTFLQTQLLEAIHIESPTFITRLIAYGADVDFWYEGGYTPLIYAIRERKKRAIRSLIQNGADIDLGYPLISAIRNGDRWSIDLLIRQHVTINHVGMALITAIKEHLMPASFFHIWHSLEKRYPEPVNQKAVIKRLFSTKDEIGNTPLHYAVMTDDDDVVGCVIPIVGTVSFIIPEGQRQMRRHALDTLFRAQNNDGDTPLILALKFEKFSCAATVFRNMKLYDIDLDTASRDGKTAADWLLHWVHQGVDLMTLPYQIQQWAKHLLRQQQQKRHRT